MPKRALIEKRPWLLASLAAAISYYFIRDTQLPGIYQMAWKGAGVALLALYALQRHGGRDGQAIALVMGFGALGDVLIELNLYAGAIAFLFGHVTAITLYLRHRRVALTPSQKAAAVVLLIATPIISFLLPMDRAAAPGVAVYALSLGGMAAAAWSSSFPRYRVGLGAVMFVASDLLIFAGLGPLETSILPGLLIWPLYYFGQFLICTGVISTLRNREV
jgi:uncharacterized membrane protein YhhN